MVTVDGKPCRTVDEVHRVLAPVHVGDSVVVRVLRGTQLEELTVLAESAD